VAKIVIATWGSRGDVAPLTDVGCRLHEAGHEVVMTAESEFGDLITGCGLRALPLNFELEGDSDPSEVNPRKAIMQLVSPSGMRRLGEQLLDLLRDEPADALMLSPFAELAGHPLAEARNIPSIGVRLQPLSTTADYAPALLGGWSAGAPANRAAGRFAAAAVDRIYAKPVKSFREQLGLPKVSTRKLRRRRTDTEWPVLHGYSPHVVPRPADWRRGLDIVGYWWPRRTDGWQPPAEVMSFLQAGTPPVFIGFGSLMVTEKERERLTELLPQALRKAGVRGIVQAGGAGLQIPATDDILPIGDVPYDWLFDHVAAVVHACGAGTAAAGLAAGVPAVAIPNPGGDQPFWASRLRTLGVSAATLSRRKLTADRLAEAITAAVTDHTYRDNAKQLATQLADEDGAGQAVAAVERLID
jgi:UDP:flavonoid glycosyltransferase YjiC (YdhE family)